MDKKITRISFAKYILERAKNDLKDAKLLYDNKSYLSANNRAYYSIFHSIRAILALEKVDFKRHKDVIAYFNKNYINTEIFPKNLGRKISNASSVREDSDYDYEYVENAEQTADQIETAKELIKLVEEYIENEIEKNR